MKLLAEKLKKSSAYSTVAAAISSHAGAVGISGLAPVTKAVVSFALAINCARTLVFIAGDEAEATRMTEDLSVLFERQVAHFPPRDLQLFTADSASREWEAKRLSVLSALQTGSCPVVVTTADALLTYTATPALLQAGTRTLSVGDVIELDELKELLIGGGYRFCESVEGPGQFSVRGGIVDFFSPQADAPVRLELFGDEIDSMGSFDPLTQRRTEMLDTAEILPAEERLLGRDQAAELQNTLRVLYEKAQKKQNTPETLKKTLATDIEKLAGSVWTACPDRYIPLLKEDPATLFSYLPENTLFCLSESIKIRERLEAFGNLLNEEQKTLLEEGKIPALPRPLALDACSFWQQIEKKDAVFLDVFPASRYDIPVKELVSIQGKQLSGFHGRLDALLEDLNAYKSQNSEIFLSTAGEKRADNLSKLLEESGIRAVRSDSLTDRKDGILEIYPRCLSTGFNFPEIGLTVLADSEVHGQGKGSRRPKKAKNSLRSYADLVQGDLVVHVNYGIGRYDGIRKMTVDGITKDYIRIQYAGADVLYVPANQLDLLSKYIAPGENERVKLNKMGGGEWQRTKQRVRAAVRDMAKQLIALYSARNAVKGYAYSQDTTWQTEFEQQFPYEETDDQLRAIREIKDDMEKPVPMERLLCGDVGFGKTEVAMRAAFKAAVEGKQVAILVPTTILAWQHYQTILQRFQGFPIKAEVLNRFRTPTQQAAILRALRRGEINIIVGTHRLIQKDVIFQDLGLLIIDEEQRFGVAHKEKLKEIAKNIDSLTLTATPIPRTLNMALSGIRDMSVIEEAPTNRIPVQTYVMEYDFQHLVEAIQKELRRGGQVFYLYNKVDTISRVAHRLQEALPDARIVYAHGRMGEEELSSIWSALIAGEIDVLVSTTIIENGIDVPNANTLIVEDADHLGLSQLYQLRGRVGRSHRRAYAYFTFRRSKVLTEDAYKRLEVIREFTEFGSGFKIALRDLEIRGAGNVLGAEQHGHLDSVGYEMYMRLLETAVHQEQDENYVEKKECTVDLFVSAHIPESYIPSAGTRIEIYKKIAVIETKEDLEDLYDELVDRFGDIPIPVQNLCSIAQLRNRASSCGIEEIAEKERRIFFYPTKADMRIVAEISAEYNGKVLFVAQERPYLSLRLAKSDDTLKEMSAFLQRYAELFDTIQSTAPSAENK